MRMWFSWLLRAPFFFFVETFFWKKHRAPRKTSYLKGSASARYRFVSLLSKEHRSSGRFADLRFEKRALKIALFIHKRSVSVARTIWEHDVK